MKTPMQLSHPWRIVVLLLVLGGTLGCDQTTKHLARTKLNPLDSILLLGGVGELRLAENPGAFLSLGAALSPKIRTGLFSVCTGLLLLGLLFQLLRRPQAHWGAFVGLALVLAGGMGNLIDRFTRQGFVTDFITLRWGPFRTGVFNVADMAVMLGLGLFLWAAWRKTSADRSDPPRKP